MGWASVSSTQGEPDEGYKVIIRVKSISIERNSVDLEFLMSRWITETDTFIVFWGGVSLTGGRGHADVTISVWRGTHYWGDLE